MNKDFCKRFKKLRTDGDMSQKDLAKTLGIYQTQVSKWELGQLEPDLNSLIQIAFVFGVTTDYLLGLSNEIIKPAKAPKDDMSGAYDEPRKKAAG
ncbi:MAG: helix-turn-helix domain-containing protein [Clostridiales bacterium]|nr:helix-turn-helix domain-containing protein [Clostridiales bacterium]